MVLNQGIESNVWVTIDGSCSLECAVAERLAQFEFGTRAESLNLLADERALERLVRVANEVLERLRAVPEDQDVSFTVMA
jgi:histidinol dehydrogenase